MSNLYDCNDLEDISEEEMEETLNSLVEKGLLEKIIMEDGKPGCKLTLAGQAFRNHMDSNPKTRN